MHVRMRWIAGTCSRKLAIHRLVVLEVDYYVLDQAASFRRRTTVPETVHTVFPR